MEIAKEYNVLDLGCGTATLTILIKKTRLEAGVVGFDADSKILSIARSKIKKAGLAIALNLGTALCLPYVNNSFERVASSMVIHHLTRENKILALKEVFRVLKPNGELHVADFGKPQNIIMHFPSLIIRHLEEASDNVKGLLPEFFQLAGFEEIEEIRKYMSIFGTISLYKMCKPRE
jgi:ubiquinone/menaquinone biosynthesis C-methylase UbiE